MLQASLRPGKSSHWRQYNSDHKALDFARRHLEDELVSTILGPLHYLPAQQVYRFWRRLLQTRQPDLAWDDNPPASCQPQFWPARSSGKYAYIEPDLQVDFAWPPAGGNTARHVLLVEVKWNAGPSGAMQLRRQWLHYLTAQERQHATHVLLVRDARRWREAVHRKNRALWAGRLHLLTWGDLRRTAHALRHGADGLARWAAHVDDYLARIGVARLQGLAAFGQTHWQLPPVPAAPLFWRGQTFWGWLPAFNTQFKSGD